MVDAANFKPKTVYVTYIAAPAEKVWQALTDPAFSKQYFFGLWVDVEPKQAGAFVCCGRMAGFMSAVKSWIGRHRTASPVRGWSRA